MAGRLIKGEIDLCKCVTGKLVNSRLLPQKRHAWITEQVAAHPSRQVGRKTGDTLRVGRPKRVALPLRVGADIIRRQVAEHAPRLLLDQLCLDNLRRAE